MIRPLESRILGATTWCGDGFGSGEIIARRFLRSRFVTESGYDSGNARSRESDLTPEQMHTIVANRLAITFDEVAKEAMQAAALARDHSVSFLDKLDDANGRVTLIVETRCVDWAERTEPH